MKLPKKKIDKVAEPRYNFKIRLCLTPHSEEAYAVFLFHMFVGILTGDMYVELIKERCWPITHRHDA